MHTLENVARRLVLGLPPPCAQASNNIGSVSTAFIPPSISRSHPAAMIRKLSGKLANG